MKLIFVDETGDEKYKEYFGLTCALIDSAFYRNIKEEFQRILVESGWRKDIEFKGCYLFSSTKGDTNIGIMQRIEIAEKILKLNAKKNSKIKFFYAFNEKSTNHKTDYLHCLPLILCKALQKAKKKQGKDILYLNYDQRDDISVREIYDSTASVVKEKEYIFLENITKSNSSYHTVGILYADIVGYLLARIHNISRDIELFDIPAEERKTNGKLKKYESSSVLIKKIKQLQNPMQLKTKNVALKPGLRQCRYNGGDGARVKM